MALLHDAVLITNTYNTNTNTNTNTETHIIEIYDNT